ncbi:MAG: hypothetical protein AAGF95_23095 [Chloroflexota bacterium]
MQFKLNYCLKGGVGRLIASVSLLALLFSVVGSLGSTSVSAQSGESFDQGPNNTFASTQVRLTGGFDKGSIGKWRTFVAGWACAPSQPFRDLRIDVYNFGISGGQFTQDAYLGSLYANKTREPAVAALCAGNPNQGFSGNVDGVCVGRRGATLVDIRAWAVFSDSPPVAIQLPGVRPGANVAC